MTKWEILVGEMEVITRNRLQQLVVQALSDMAVGVGSRGELGWENLQE